MKDELKTLKDLERKEGEKYGMCSYCIQRARAEAIKWVKWFRERPKTSNLDEFVDWALIGEFKNFFNLTSDNLKDLKKAVSE